MTDINDLGVIPGENRNLDVMGEIMGKISHDFNNMLTIIIGNSELLATCLDDPALKKMAQLILAAADRGADFTGQLLACAGRQQLSPEAFEINQLVDDSMEAIRQAIGPDIVLTIHKTDTPLEVVADKDRTRNALLQLCRNAKAAMAEGGALTIETSSRWLDSVPGQSNPALRPGQFVSIRVSDTGSGIAASQLDRVFEPFFTTDSDGASPGLGLSMLHGFVKQSKGFVDLRSEPGQGSSFTIFLPAAATGEGSGDAAVQVEAEAETLFGGRVLIVEDNELVREHACGVFERLGFDVVSAADTQEAISCLENHEDIRLVFTDIVMPGGVSGWDLGRVIRDRWPQIPIVFTSGYSDALSRAKGGAPIAGVDLLAKPYLNHDLLRRIRAALAQ